MMTMTLGGKKGNIARLFNYATNSTDHPQVGKFTH
jgi:hypothetical protein